jgi:hypothetical protein
LKIKLHFFFFPCAIVMVKQLQLALQKPQSKLKRNSQPEWNFWFPSLSSQNQTLGFGIKGGYQEKIPSLPDSKIASWVGPTEKEMVTTFLNTLKDVYYAHLIRHTTFSFPDLVIVREHVEDGMKSGRLMDTHLIQTLTVTAAKRQETSQQGGDAQRIITTVPPYRRNFQQIITRERERERERENLEKVPKMETKKETCKEPTFLSENKREF